MNWPHLPFQPHLAQGVRAVLSFWHACLGWCSLTRRFYHSLSPAFFLFTDPSSFSSGAYLTLTLLAMPVLCSHEIPSVYAIVLERLLRYIREDRLPAINLDNYLRNGDMEKGSGLMITHFGTWAQEHVTWFQECPSISSHASGSPLASSGLQHMECKS